MRHLPGQALRLVRRLVALTLGLATIAGIGLGAAAWRLSQGPLDLPFVAARIEDAFNQGGGPTRLEIGRAALAWDGWRAGYSPFELRLSGVRAVEEGGGVRAELPDAVVSLSHRWLLVGRLVPRRIELTGVRLRVMRAPDGGMALDLGSLVEGADPPPDSPPDAAAQEATGAMLTRILGDLADERADHAPLAALERVSVRDARIQVVDEQLGAVWTLDTVGIELTRRAGGMELDGRATLVLGEERVRARLLGTLRGAPARIEATVTLLDVRPAALARQARLLAPLAALDATLALELRMGGRADGGGASLAALVHAGPGTLDLGDGRRLAIAGLDLSFVATPQAARLERAVLRLAPPTNAPPARRGGTGAPGRREETAAPGRREGPILSLAGEARREDGQWRTSLRAAVDAVPVPDLEHYWPVGMAEGGRVWLTRNLTAGTARNARFTVEAMVPETLDDLRIVALSGTLDAEAVTAHWLRPIGPVEGVTGTAEFGLDGIVVRIRAGRQSGTAVEVRDATLRFGGFDRGPGEAELAIRLGGPLPEVMTVLRHPRLRLFERQRVAVPDLTGMVREARITLGFPLLAALPIEDVRMQAEARVTELRAPRAVLGRDLERGTADLTVDMEGLRVQAQATLAEIPVRVGVEMDFRAGGAAQIVSRETLSGRADVRQLAAFGLDLRDWATGNVTIDARNETRRVGGSRLVLRGDLRDARVSFGALGWQKPRGTAGSAEAVLRVQGDTVQAMETLRLEAPDALLRARSGPFRFGLPERLEILEATLGATRFTGEMRGPRAPGAEWTALLRGPMLDLRAAFAERGDAEEPPRRVAGEAGTPFLIEWRFDRAVLGEGREATAFAGRSRLDAAGVLREAEVQARFGTAGVQARIVPEGERRRLTVNSDNGGGLLRLLDIVPSVDGGRLAVDAVFEHPRPGAPLTGQAELSDFSVRDAPALGKLLQAMTLYGMFEAMSGPGLSFARLIAPFRLTREAIELNDARAFSASLGLTARGRIDRRRSLVDMEGTIVPAYFFNQLLGNIPILGLLFSPEAGGGLFAASYRLRGPLADPQVSVNPLTALTPGFLRGIFGVGQEAPPRTSPQLQQQSTPRPAPPARQVQDAPLRGPPGN